MASTYYEPGQGRAARVTDLFQTIAPRYDLVNDLQSFGLHRRWKRRLAALAAVGPGQRALDVCCGTGDVALRLAEGGAEVVGLDFSEAMLEVARKRLDATKESRLNRPFVVRPLGRCGAPGVASSSPDGLKPTLRTAGQPGSWFQRAVRGLRTLPKSPEPERKFDSPRGPVRFMVGDALQLPFPDRHFDAVTVAYGLRNLADWSTGLREMWRVAKPGGRLLALDFGKPDNALWRWVYFSYLRWIVPVFGRLFWGEPALYAYILESLKCYPAQHGVAGRMRELGCADVRIFNVLGGVMTINCGLKAD